MASVSDARTRMIDAAERLAVDRGLGAMSLREVQIAAGQRNKSAAVYHFGDKEGLIRAVLAARMGPANTRRTAMLDALEAPSLRELVEVLVVPLADATRHPGSTYARFLLQGLADPVLNRIVESSVEGRSYVAVRALIIDLLVAVPPAMRRRRVRAAMHLMVSTLAYWEANEARVPAQARHDLIEMCLALLTAPGPFPRPDNQKIKRQRKPRDSVQLESLA